MLEPRFIRIWLAATETAACVFTSKVAAKLDPFSSLQQNTILVPSRQLHLGGRRRLEVGGDTQMAPCPVGVDPREIGLLRDANYVDSNYGLPNREGLGFGIFWDQTLIVDAR